MALGPEASSGRGVPPLDHRVPERVEHPARRRLRGGAADRRAMVRAVPGAAGRLHPVTRSRLGFYDVGFRARPARCSTSSGWCRRTCRWSCSGSRHQRSVLANPSNLEIAEAFGLAGADPGRRRLATWRWSALARRVSAVAVYASSEGLRTVVVEAEAIGGQAATSSMIRNYPGFSQGVSGSTLTYADLPAGLVLRHHVPVHAAGDQSCRAHDGHYRLGLSDGNVLTARAVVIATGAAYTASSASPTWRTCTAGGLLRRGGQRGVRHARAEGASSSAAGTPPGRRRYTWPSGPTRSRSWSAGVAGPEHVGLPHPHDRRRCRTWTSPTASRWFDGAGTDLLSRWCWRTGHPGSAGTSLPTGCSSSSAQQPRHRMARREPDARPVRASFCTGPDVLGEVGDAHWPLLRSPSLHEASLPGVFAVGDVRRGRSSGVASAVGEGAVTIPQVHAFLRHRRPCTPTAER